jgi:hypothetical protein
MMLAGESHERSPQAGRQFNPSKSFLKMPPLAPLRANLINRPESHFSNAKIRFQSSFMLITIQPFLFASAIKASEKVPT